MFYRVDADMMHGLGLQGREAMVYSVLLYLCKNAPWKGTDTELADMSCCGNRKTAFRMRERLQQKGLIIKTADGISIGQNDRPCGQNDRPCGQNDRPCGQNDQISKRKSNQKENINNNNNEVSVSNAHTQEEFLYKIIVSEKGYLNPKKYVQEMYEYYNAHGWPQGDKPGMMRLWMTREVKMRGGDKPQLNENERTYMRTFLDALPQYAVVHFCDVLRGFKMTDKKAVFYFSADKAHAVAQWLMDIGIADKMVAYGREMTAAVCTI